MDAVLRLHLPPPNLFYWEFSLTTRGIDFSSLIEVLFFDAPFPSDSLPPLPGCAEQLSFSTRAATTLILNLPPHPPLLTDYFYLNTFQCLSSSVQPSSFLNQGVVTFAFSHFSLRFPIAPYFGPSRGTSVDVYRL